VSPVAARFAPLPDGFEPPDAFWDALAAQYADPPRGYHTLDHIVAVATTWREVPDWEHPLDVLVALLFHDAVYVAGRTDNEARSAELAQDAIGRFGLAVDADRVAALILATAGHGHVPGAVDADTARFLDCDLAILGADPATYARYAAGVRQEYLAVLTPEAYAAGRAAFLERFLALPRWFLTDGFHERLDARARANVAGELAALR
jgi:predicted metal-dependent HD superfamily phosphohydrolase